DDPLDQIVCDNSGTKPVNFTGTGTTYNWTNSNPAIGLAASGSGDIPSFTAINTGTSPIIATISVTPIAIGCAGTAQTFTITVNPIPTVNDPADQTACNNGATTAISFTGAIPATSYFWTNDAPSIGLVASGLGNIPSFTAINSGTSPVTATITVTPIFNNCAGTPQTFTITVYPRPTVTVPANAVVCNNSLTGILSFSGAVAGTTYNWTNNTPSIGLTASGSGDIPAFTAINTGTTIVTATVTVTPVANGCAGAPQTFTITVNPTPLPPTNSAINITECETNPIQTLNANSVITSSVPVIWYTQATGGTVVASPTLNTTNTVTYFAEAVNSTTNCSSLSRTAVTLTINPAPLSPTVSAASITECETSPVQALNANSVITSSVPVTWYTQATGGTLVASPTLSSTGNVTYFAEAVNSTTNCSSLSRTAVTLTISPAPAAPALSGSAV
ncbi:PKD-like domain-containing protein, partial [Pedobacter sp. P351]|uniref:Ig-like domain-containing protein n=1 Tax=Pedobacter superstes TaxID=3133441 RepID=UPI0030AC937A